MMQILSQKIALGHPVQLVLKLLLMLYWAVKNEIQSHCHILNYHIHFYN